MKMTITQYATKTGVKRDTVHKRIKRGDKLDGVTKIEKIGDGKTSSFLLHVRELK